MEITAVQLTDVCKLTTWDPSDMEALGVPVARSKKVKHQDWILGHLKATCTLS